MNNQVLIFQIVALLLTPACADPPAVAASENRNAGKLAAKLPVDIAELRDSEKTAFSKLIEKLPSACGKAHSLRVSLESDAGCKRSVFAARYLFRLFKEHLLESEVEERYADRFSSTPRLNFELANAPARGKPHCPVVLVEFSDFQCPHCKILQPILREVLEAYPDRVQLFFKNYPIVRAHPDAATAAAAALAAGKQGKFWLYHDRLYGGNQEQMDLGSLAKIAKELKLDMKRWKVDLEDMKGQVNKDHQEGERADISATPTLFINGRKYQDPYTVEDLKDWIEEELNR